MKFQQQLKYYRERANMNKTSVANKLNVTLSYYTELENGRKKPPTLDRCREIARILNLSLGETNRFIDFAMEERAKPEVVEWLSEKYPPEIIEALKDPMAVKALLATHKNKEDLKKIIRELAKGFPHISKEEQKAILRLCSG